MTTPIKPSTPPIGDGATAFSRSDAARVAEATRYVEREYRNSPVRTPREPRGGGSPFAVIKVTTACVAGSGTGGYDSTGRGTLYVDGGGGSFTATSATGLVLRNPLDQGIAVNAYIYAQPTTDGAYLVLGPFKCSVLV